LQQMNKSLLIFEKEPKSEEAINSIFRSAHTLKSMSASMGYYPVSDLSHKMEDVLDQLRSGTIAASGKVVDVLFKAFDSLEYMISLIQEEKKIDKDITPLMAVLDNIMVKGPEIKEEKTRGKLSLNAFEKKTLARVKREGFSCHEIRIQLDKNCVLKSVRAFMVFRNLHEVGEVIKSMPDSQTLEEERFGDTFGCVFITKEKKTAVEKKVVEVLDVSKVTIREIAIPKSWEKEPIQKDISLPVEEPIYTEPASGEGVRKIQSVRVDIARLDKLMNLVEELAINKLRLGAISLKIGNIDLKAIVEELNRLTDELQTEVMQARLVPVGQIFERFPRLVRDLAKREGKKVSLEVAGADIELDRTVLDEIGDPLIHILRNAVDHGIEAPQRRKGAGKDEEGKVMLLARREKSHVFIEVEDNGSGMDIEKIKEAALRRGIVSKKSLAAMGEEEILLLTAQPGFSTSQHVTDVSGRGVGLDVAKEKTEALGGSLTIETKHGVGTKIAMRLPITTAVVQALMVDIMGKAFALPVSSVIEITTARPRDIKRIEKSETIMHRDTVLPVMRLDKLFKTIGHRPKTEDQRPKTEDRRPKTGESLEVHSQPTIGDRQPGICNPESVIRNLQSAWNLSSAFRLPGSRQF